MFGADLWASDWNPMTPEQELKLLTARLNAAGKGIILLHDPKARTAAMLPAFLRYLRTITIAWSMLCRPHDLRADGDGRVH